MRPIRLLFLIVLPLYLISCGTQKKAPYYLENVKDSIPGDVKTPDLRIQKNDLLSIQVYSASTKPELSDALYNLPCNTSTGGASNANVCGFLVDANGDIEYPRLGTIHAEGMTKQELAIEVKKRLTQPVERLKDPNVIIRFLNYKVTVLGQVAHEGIVEVLAERVTILEAIGLAGGITDYGKKDAVKVLREINGKREVGYVDLSSDSLFVSPYYNLMQNDVVTVEPTKQKRKQVDQAIVAQRITFALGLITSAAFIYNVFK
ncbi:MAG: polysaccharide export protein [Chitinophagaceae bacterium]|nr:polysaccharide export protein [Chitinophagaceae bacterium]